MRSPSPINPVANPNWSAGYTIWRHLTSSALKNRAECTNKDASAEDADAPNVRDRVTRGGRPLARLLRSFSLVRTRGSTNGAALRRRERSCAPWGWLSSTGPNDPWRGSSGLKPSRRRRVAMSNSSDKDKADRGNDTPPDAPYEVRNKKPPRHGQFKPCFLAIRRVAERKRQSSHAGSGRGFSQIRKRRRTRWQSTARLKTSASRIRRLCASLARGRSQRTSSASVIPFRASANELSARNYGKDIPELWEGQDEITTMTLRN